MTNITLIKFPPPSQLCSASLTVYCHACHRLNTLGGPTESWERQWFALDQEALRSGGALQLMLRSRGHKQVSYDGAVSADDYIVYLSDIVSAVRCLELSLPEGEAFWIGLRSRPQVRHASGAAQIHVTAPFPSFGYCKLLLGKVASRPFVSAQFTKGSPRPRARTNP